MNHGFDGPPPKECAMKKVPHMRSGHITALSGERGVTLVELMVATTIALILVTLIFQFFTTQSKSFMETRQNAETQQELRWALQFLSENVKLAGNGVPPVSIDLTGFQVIDNADGASGAPDSLSVIGSFRSLVITLDQSMANENLLSRAPTRRHTAGGVCTFSNLVTSR